MELNKDMTKVLLEFTSVNPTRIRHFFTFKRIYGKFVNLSQANCQFSKILMSPLSFSGLT